MKYALLALTLIAGSAMADCKESAENTATLMADVQEVSTQIVDEGPNKRNMKALVRRIESVERSLISMRVYCGGNAEAISLANDIADNMDELRAALGID